MTIKVGDKIPSVTVKYASSEGPKEISTDDLFKGKKAILFSVPGAFTPTCSAKHLPSFLNNYDALKQKGIDLIACMAVNDAFVMSAWGKDQNVGDKVTMVADGSGVLTKALGLELDLSGMGLGHRSQRFAMVLDDGKVKTLNVEQGGAYDVSSAESILKTL